MMCSRLSQFTLKPWSSTALDLLVLSLVAELASRVGELEGKNGRELGRIQRDLEGAPGKLGEELQRLLSPPSGKD